jgi:competence protein ComEA
MREFIIKIFSELSDKTKAALFLAMGMGLFLIAGSLVHFFPKSQFIEQGRIDRTSDSSTSIDDLYRNLLNTDSDSGARAAKEVYKTEAQNQQALVDERWVLYVTGSVKNPGVYELPADARVFQLVEAAGGLTATADKVAVNLAARLQDGDHLHVPRIGEASTVDTSRTANAQDRQRNDAAAKNQKSNKNPPSRRIDLNTASASELQTLPGIGPAMSERIIQYRNKNGRFKRVSDLINVTGIGAKRLESIEPFLVVR